MNPIETRLREVMLIKTTMPFGNTFNAFHVTSVLIAFCLCRDCYPTSLVAPCTRRTLPNGLGSHYNILLISLMIFPPTGTTLMVYCLIE